MEKLQEKLLSFKLKNYGKIAMKLRRGMIDLAEAQGFWNTIEQECNDLEALLGHCLTRVQVNVFEAGLDHMSQN